MVITLRSSLIITHSSSDPKLGRYNTPTTPLQNTPTRPPVACGWRSVMFKDGILVAGLSVTCNSPLSPLIELYGRSKINRLVRQALAPI